MWGDNKPEYLQYIIYNYQVSTKNYKLCKETRKSDRKKKNNVSNKICHEKLRIKETCGASLVPQTVNSVCLQW